MRGARLFPAAALAASLFAVSSCGPAVVEEDAADPATPADDSADLMGTEAPPQPRLKDLGPNARRVTVVVLPGDAAVEVNGVAVFRRDGVIELTGKTTDVFRLRVFKGLHSVEKEVKIQDTGADPALVDLNAPLPVAPGVKGVAGPSKPKDEDDPLLSGKFQ
jgi:hypothetical protein